MGTNSNGNPIWTREEDKVFENGIALYGNVHQLENIAVMIPGKSIEEVKKHFQILVDDIKAIEAGHVPLPDYGSSFEQEEIGCEKRKAKSIADRRKGVPWTEEEHSRFLQGLDKCGRGDWRGIARHFVLTRTAAQVASHAQKYFQRMQPGNQKKRRPSIHDVKTVAHGCKSGPVEGASSQLPISTDDMGEFHAQMTDNVGMHGDISAHQGIILPSWTSDIDMHGDKNTNFLSTRPTILESNPNVMEMTGVVGDRSAISYRPVERYGVGGGLGSDMPVLQMPVNPQSSSLTPVDTIDDSGSLIPSTDVDISFGFSPTARDPNI